MMSESKRLGQNETRQGAGLPFATTPAPNTRIKPPPARDGCLMSCPTPAVGLNELLGPYAEPCDSASNCWTPAGGISIPTEEPGLTTMPTFGAMPFSNQLKFVRSPKAN